MSKAQNTQGPAHSSNAEVVARAERVRRFNRFYTRHIGVLQERLVDSPFSLTEARILFELAHRESVAGSDLARELGLDAGYVSRVLSGFEKKGLLNKKRSETDARVTELHLTEMGRASFAELDKQQRQDVLQSLEGLSGAEQQQLLDAMAGIEELLGERTASYVLRDPRPGDMGWVVYRQAVLYAQEYGWNSDFEALVAEIVAKYLREFDPKRERCWIAEKNGQGVGSVFVVREDDTTAKLRLFYVEPSARGLGIGTRLVDESLRFARLAGYKRMLLWTNSVLVDARRIYERAGFVLLEEEAHQSFGKDLIGQVWGRDL